MLRKTEKYFKKRINERHRGKTYYMYDLQYIKRTTYWLLWIIPIFSKEEVQKGEYENK
jgi:hypothetical protein